MAPGDDDDDVDIIGYGEETAALVRNISLTYDTCIPFNRPVHLDWQRSPLLKNVSFIENSYVSLPAVSLRGAMDPLTAIFYKKVFVLPADSTPAHLIIMRFADLRIGVLQTLD